MMVAGERAALPHLGLRRKVKELAMCGERWKPVFWLRSGQGMRSEGDPPGLPVLAVASWLWLCGTELSLGGPRACALAFPPHFAMPCQVGF